MISFPFTSQDGDRKITAVQFRAIFRKYFTNGVFMNPSTEFQIMEVGGMNVTAKAGYANINGVIAYEETDTELTIETAEAKDRIDRIVLRLNDNTEARNVSLVVIKGTASDSPTAPALTRNESVYDLGLATIYVNGSTTNITQSKITDTRLDTTVCGVVSGTVKEADTETLYAQIQSDLAEFKTNEQAEFIEWFNSIKDKLGEDLAGNLQLQIDDINDTKTSLTDANGSPIVTAPMTPPQNLLINGDFKIWQRGETITMAMPSGYKYFADMWNIYWHSNSGLNHTLTKVDNGMKINTNETNTEISQFVEPLKDNITYTASCSINGTIYTININGGNNVKGNHLRYQTDRASRNKDRLFVTGLNDNDIVNWVQLNEGSVAYPHVEEDDAIALMRCQDFFRAGYYMAFCIFAYGNGTRLLRMTFEKMHDIPSLKLTISYLNSQGVNHDTTNYSIQSTLNGVVSFLLNDTTANAVDKGAVRVYTEISCEPL